MKKVAFCLRGAVSKKNGVTGSLLKENSNDDYIDYVKCRNSIFKFIISKNPSYQIDFFCHCWNVDLKNNLEELYKPKKSLFENNNSYIDDIIERCKVLDHKKRKQEVSGISQSLTIKKSLILKEEYEKENNCEYDIVILYRYDVLLWKDMILDNYNLNSSNIYVNGHPEGNGDFHFVTSNSNSAAFKGLYDSPLNNNPFKQHFWIKNYLVNFCNKTVLTDEIAPGVHQEVFRNDKLKYTKSHLTQEILDMLDTGLEVKKKTIAIIFAGKSNHKLNPNFKYFDSFYSNIIMPLVEFNILIFIGCYEKDKLEWEENLGNKLKVKNLSNVNVIYNTNMPDEDFILNENNASNLNENNASNLNKNEHKYKISAIYQYSKLFYTFKNFESYCIENNIKTDFVFKCRFDLIYKNDNLFNVKWLNELCSNRICVPSTEFHMLHRWSDGSMGWPNMICDQLIFGNLYNMTKYFNFYKSEIYTNENIAFPEKILARYLISNNINCAAIELQVSQPGGKYKLGQNNKWLKTESGYIKYLDVPNVT